MCGTITVSLEDVRAYANGNQVALRFGNATSVTLSTSKPQSSGVDISFLFEGTSGLELLLYKNSPVHEQHHSQNRSFKGDFQSGNQTLSPDSYNQLELLDSITEHLPFK